MRLLRLQGRKICDTVLRKGRNWRGEHCFVRCLPGHPRHPSARPAAPALYVGTLASTKLSKSAVDRNRMRRRLREALRKSVLALQEDVASAQLLVSPRSSSLKAPFEALCLDMERFLRTLACPPPPRNPRAPASSISS